MTPPQWQDVVSVVVILAAIFRAGHAIVAYLYVRDVYEAGSRDVAEQARLVKRDRVIAWCCGGLVVLCAWSLASFTWPEIVPAVPRPFGTLWVLLMVYVMTRGPIDDRRAWQRLRERRSVLPEPVWTEEDAR